MLKKFLTISLMFCVSSASYAADSYEKLDRVSVIVFTQNSSSTEAWPKNYQAPNLTNTQDLSAATTPPAPYQLLPMDTFPLAKELTTLQAQGKQIVLAESWLQPPIQDTAWIHLTGGAQDVNGIWPLNGKLKINRNGTYSLALDLFYNLPNNSEAVPAGIVNEHTIRLQQVVRIKPTQLVYFDHPLFGVLVLVTPNS